MPSRCEDCEFCLNCGKWRKVKRLVSLPALTEGEGAGKCLCAQPDVYLCNDCGHMWINNSSYDIKLLAGWRSVRQSTKRTMKVRVRFVENNSDPFPLEWAIRYVTGIGKSCDLVYQDGMWSGTAARVSMTQNHLSIEGFGEPDEDSRSAMGCTSIPRFQCVSAAVSEDGNFWTELNVRCSHPSVQRCEIQRKILSGSLLLQQYANFCPFCSTFWEKWEWEGQESASR